jgi:hypothetical protein
MKFGFPLLPVASSNRQLPKASTLHVEKKARYTSVLAILHVRYAKYAASFEKSVNLEICPKTK